jgi:hypothetical protein
VVHAVVNHLKLGTPLDEDVVGRMSSEMMAEAAEIPGFVSAYCVQIADDEIVMIVVCASEEALERVTQEVGSPWVGANLLPYLAGTDRKTGPVIASPQAR